jgi:hypothetical protein
MKRSPVLSADFSVVRVDDWRMANDRAVVRGW